MQCIPNVFPSLLQNKNVARWCKMWQASKDSWKFKLGINSHFNGQSNMGSMDMASLNHKIQQPLSRGFNQLRKSDDHRILHMFFDGLLVSNKPSLRTTCSQSIIGSPFHLSGNSFLQQIHVLVDPRTITGMVSVWFHLHPFAINFKGYQSAGPDYLGPSNCRSFCQGIAHWDAPRGDIWHEIANEHHVNQHRRHPIEGDDHIHREIPHRTVLIKASWTLHCCFLKSGAQIIHFNGIFPHQPSILGIP